MSACECREKIDELLAARNTRVKQVFTIGESVGMPWPVATEQVETGRGKEKAVLLFASHCPFCGVSLRASAEGQRTTAREGE